LLGCTGIAAPFGLIFGIIGVVTTRGGRRRGLGLAVAAIPISVVMGVISVFLALGMAAGVGIATLLTQLPSALNADQGGIDTAVTALRAIATDDFNTAVGDAELKAWLVAIADKHGRLVEVVPSNQVQPSPGSDRFMVNLDGKFVNGRSNVAVILRMEGWRIKLDDIQVDGSSPRDVGR
jgi:hypothetical protein